MYGQNVVFIKDFYFKAGSLRYEDSSITKNGANYATLL